jgi:hypothetical protein
VVVKLNTSWLPVGVGVVQEAVVVVWVLGVRVVC